MLRDRPRGESESENEGDSDRRQRQRERARAADGAAIVPWLDYGPGRPWPRPKVKPSLPSVLLRARLPATYHVIVPSPVTCSARRLAVRTAWAAPPPPDLSTHMVRTDINIRWMCPYPCPCLRPYPYPPLSRSAVLPRPRPIRPDPARSDRDACCARITGARRSDAVVVDAATASAAAATCPFVSPRSKGESSRPNGPRGRRGERSR